jgi:hypothetical protein
MQVLRKAFKRVTALIEILPMAETAIEGDLSWLSFLKGTLVCHNDRLQLLASEVDCSISEVPPFSKMFFVDDGTIDFSDCEERQRQCDWSWISNCKIDNCSNEKKEFRKESAYSTQSSGHIHLVQQQLDHLFTNGSLAQTVYINWASCLASSFAESLYLCAMLSGEI